MKKIIFIAVMLTVSVTLTARQKPADQEKQKPQEQEQAMVQRLYETQTSGSDTDFYEAHQTFMDYLEERQDWEKYYRTWMNRVIYDVNHKYFHRAFAEINYITDDIEERHQERYLYIANMGLGFFYNGRNQPELGEKYFRRALQGIDAEKDPVSVFNSYLSLAQSLSFKRPAEAMACLDSLPQQMLENPMYESGVLGYRCIIANKMGDYEAFHRYFTKYDSILTATELRIDVYEQMGDWKQAFRASEQKDSLLLIAEREALELHTADMARDIDQLQAEQEKAKIRHVQLLIVGLMALTIIALLIGMLVYRHNKNRRLKEQFLQLQESRKRTEAGQAIRRAFVSTIQEKLKSPINVLRGYARIFNNPDFILNPDERPKRYNDILTAARTIESLMDPVLDSYARGTVGISYEEKQVCMDALRSPLITLINTSEVIIDGNGLIPHDEYMQLRASVCRDAYRVATIFPHLSQTE